MNYGSPVNLVRLGPVVLARRAGQTQRVSKNTVPLRPHEAYFLRNASRTAMAQI
jgi:hypothetical protein